MRRFWQMIQMLAAVCAVCLAVVLNWQGRDDAAAPGHPLHQASTVATTQHHHHQEATLTDASQLYRICSSRPQRILSSQGSKTERILSSHGPVALRQHIVKPLRSFYDSRCRLESAPFCLSASCDYYVIALRRILR